MKPSGNFHPIRYIFKLMRKFIRNSKLLDFLLRIRTNYRLFLWKVEYALFSSIRRSKKLCVIYIGETKAGFFACFLRILSGIAYADRHAMIPVVDMKNHYNAYLEEGELGKVNTWEYYFRQPGGISLDEALTSSRTVSRNIRTFPSPRVDHSLFYNIDGQLDYWRYICRKYIVPSLAVQNEIDKFKKKFTGKRVLGVSLRGTDYVVLKLHDHPVQPESETVITKAVEAMRENNFDALYLSTEDKNIVARFQEVFGEKLLLHDEKYVDFDYNSDKWITHYSTNREHDKYLMGFKYVVSKLLLMECAGLITTMTCGTTALMCMSQEWEYLYVLIWDITVRSLTKFRFVAIFSQLTFSGLVAQWIERLPPKQ